MFYNDTCYFVYDELEQEHETGLLNAFECRRGAGNVDSAILQHRIPNIKYLYPSILRMICYGDKAFDRANMTEKRLFPMTLPDHFALDPRLSTVAIRRRVDGYREELMQAAWHPDRFMDWCLAIDDKDQKVSA
jgi:hypothetical protein